MTRGKPNRSIREDCRDHYILYPLRDARLAVGYTARAVAFHTGVTRMSYLHYEHLRCVPSPEHAKKIATLLQRDVVELFPPCLRYLVHDIKRERRELDQFYHLTLPLYDEYAAPDDPVLEAESHLDPFSFEQLLVSLLNTLPPRYAEIMRLRYGINCDRSHTRPEIADRLHLTRQRVGQLECKALDLMRDISHSRLPDF